MDDFLKHEFHEFPLVSHHNHQPEKPLQHAMLPLPDPHHHNRAPYIYEASSSSPSSDLSSSNSNGSAASISNNGSHPSHHTSSSFHTINNNSQPTATFQNQTPTKEGPPLPNNNNNNNNNNSLRVIIYHKPRSIEGGWHEITEGTHIRATRDRGKKMRVVVEDPMGRPFCEKDCSLSLISQSKPAVLNSDWSIQSQKMIAPNAIEYILKLFTLSKQIQFEAVLRFSFIHIFKGISVSFCSHNNGHRQSEMKRHKAEQLPPAPTVIETDLHVLGIVRAKQFVQDSDLRYKTNISEISNALETIKHLQGKKYCWKPGVALPGQEDQKVFGLIAQDLEVHLPELVKKDPVTGMLSVDYIQLVPILLQAFKEMWAQYSFDREKLKDEIGQIQDQLNKINSKDLELVMSTQFLFFCETAKKKKNHFKVFCWIQSIVIFVALLNIFLGIGMVIAGLVQGPPDGDPAQINSKAAFATTSHADSIPVLVDPALLEFPANTPRFWGDEAQQEDLSFLDSLSSPSSPPSPSSLPPSPSRSSSKTVLRAPLNQGLAPPENEKSFAYSQRLESTSQGESWQTPRPGNHHSKAEDQLISRSSMHNRLVLGGLLLIVVGCFILFVSISCLLIAAIYLPK